MDREILFRGKDKDDGNWYEGYYLQLHDTTYCCMPSDNADEANRLNEENKHHYIVFEQMTDWGLPNKHLRAEVDPKTVCQYTGLTDKNCRKIFEWDIVRRTDPHNEKEPSVGFIKYDTENTAFLIHWTDIINCSATFPWKDRIEIIGNIFDNPELLKGDRAE